MEIRINFIKFDFLNFKSGYSAKFGIFAVRVWEGQICKFELKFDREIIKSGRERSE